MSDTPTNTLIADEPSVNMMIRQHPATVEVFNRFGIDACCGGAASITDAARRDGADPEIVWSALREIPGVGA